MDSGQLRSLAASIILRAVADYPKALEDERNPEYDKDGNIKVNKWLNKKELDKFFKSAWFEELCDCVNIDKAHILAKIEEMRKEHENGVNRN